MKKMEMIKNVKSVKVRSHEEQRRNQKKIWLFDDSDIVRHKLSDIYH